MKQPNDETIQSFVDFFILSTLSIRPTNRVGIEQRVEGIARRLFKRGPGLVAGSLQRMGRLGWLADEGKFYALTYAGKEQLESERARRSSVLARFVEEGKGFVYELGKVMQQLELTGSFNDVLPESAHAIIQ